MEAKPPLQKVTFYEDEATFQPVQGVDWKTLVALDIFYGFRPGITFQEAIKKFGPPSEIGSNHYGPYYIYKKPRGQVWIAWEEHKSGGDSYKVWTLRAYPADASLKTVLDPAIVNYIRPGVSLEGVVILNAQGEPAISLKIVGSRVRSITWIRAT